jgi:hypothetical protein
MSDPDQPRSRILATRIVTDSDGHATYEGDAEAIAAVRAARARAIAREERRAEVWGPIGPEAMTALARRFPGLRDALGVDPWDSVELLRWALGGRSHGEILAAKFVLSVWNSSTDWEEMAREEGLLARDGHFSRFDLFEAMSVWDDEHVEAMVSWLQLPFFP